MEQCHVEDNLPQLEKRASTSTSNSSELNPPAVSNDTPWSFATFSLSSPTSSLPVYEAAPEDGTIALDAEDGVDSESLVTEHEALVLEIPTWTAWSIGFPVQLPVFEQVVEQTTESWLSTQRKFREPEVPVQLNTEDEDEVDSDTKSFITASSFGLRQADGGDDDNNSDDQSARNISESDEMTEPAFDLSSASLEYSISVHTDAGHGKPCRFADPNLSSNATSLKSASVRENPDDLLLPRHVVAENARFSWFHPSLKEAAIRAASSTSPLLSQWLSQNHNGEEVILFSASEKQSALDLESPFPKIHLRGTHGRSSVATDAYTCDFQVETTQPLSHSRSVISAYQSSIRSWCDSIMAPSDAPLLSSDTPLSNNDDRECPNFRQTFITNEAGSRSGPFGGGIGSAGTAVEKVKELVLTTGHVTLDFLTDTVAPATFNFAQRSATVTKELLAAHLQAVPTLFARSRGEGKEAMEREGRLPQTAGGTGGHDDGIPIQQQHYTQHKSKVTDHRKDEQHASSGRRSKSVPDLMSQAKARGVGLSGGGAAWPLTRPTSALLESALHRRLVDQTIPLMTINSPDKLHAGEPKNNKIQRSRRMTFQALPGPENMDPEIRRQLEARGLASLGLHDGADGRTQRSWWDPRRYGLPKYIVCGGFRRPRPCTVILLAVLVVCIVLPVVFRH